MIIDRLKRKRSKRAPALFAVGVVSILWGTTWMASKVGVRYIPALQLSGLRHLIGGGLYVLYYALFKKMVPQKHQFIQIAWMSILMFVLSNGLSVLSVVYMPSGLGAVVGARSSARSLPLHTCCSACGCDRLVGERLMCVQCQARPGSARQPGSRVPRCSVVATCVRL